MARRAVDAPMVVGCGRCGSSKTGRQPALACWRPFCARANRRAPWPFGKTRTVTHICMRESGGGGATMSALFRIDAGSARQSVAVVLYRLAVLLLPTALLLGAALRYAGPDTVLLWIAAAFQAAICGLTFVSRRSWRQPLGPSVITLYLVALAWLWCSNNASDWYAHLTKAL